jgi:hypothetical protein
MIVEISTSIFLGGPKAQGRTENADCLEGVNKPFRCQRGLNEGLHRKLISDEPFLPCYTRMVAHLTDRKWPNVHLVSIYKWDRLNPRHF